MTTVYKDARNNWAAEDEISLPNGQQLRISTHKVYSGNLVTTATVGRLEDGFFSYVMFQDFSKRVITQKPAKCTGRIVEGQHATALADIETLKQEITDFYSVPQPA